MLEGEVESVADGKSATRSAAGDVFWTGVGCVHAFYNTQRRNRVSGSRPRRPAPQSPLVPIQPRLGLPGGAARAEKAVGATKQ